MKKSIICLAAAATLLSLVGCGKQKVNCSDPIGTSSVTEILTKETTKQLEEIKGSDGASTYKSSSIELALKEIGISIENIRTSKEDPNSTKVQCEASLKISPAAKFLADADSGVKLIKNPESIEAYSRRIGFEFENNSFSKTIEYSLQPTDDGAKVVTTVLDVKSIADFLSNLIAAAIIKPMIEESKSRNESISVDQQKELIARASLKLAEIENQLDLFKLDIGRYPTNDEGLHSLVENSKSIPLWNGPYLKDGLPKDPWGVNYHYQNPGRNGSPDVSSYGPDKKPGGDGVNADIYN
ncbi:type II secretion system major pseudopilin GspG [Acidovorax sp.]|uniref:type II secretion system major pseudopilin GspG n=1 Tax=Acidovorax sp. TaxID=1872122 RepID=UPI0025BF5AAE|nr:type II secretion system major pseudopilin GspG [Acidovorax sp.]